MLVKTKAIILHSLRYGEKKLIVELLSREQGRTVCVTTLKRNSKGAPGRQLFQPLTLLEVVLDVRPTARMATLKDARMTIPYASIPFEPLKLSVAMFVAEFLLHATRGEQPDPLLYDFVESSLQWLDDCQGSIANFHLVLMLRMTRFAGIYPNLEHYTPGCCFDLRAGCFTATHPLHKEVVEPADASRLQALFRMHYATMHLFRLSREERNRIADMALLYYQLHVPEFRPLKSVEVLRSLFT